MMVDDAVAAPVLAQPSTPFPVTPSRSRDLNLSDAVLVFGSKAQRAVTRADEVLERVEWRPSRSER